MKNHILTLLGLREAYPCVDYDIYGPVEDENYWNECLHIIDTLPSNINVNYKGSVNPTQVSLVLAENHCL